MRLWEPRFRHHAQQPSLNNPLPPTPTMQSRLRSKRTALAPQLPRAAGVRRTMRAATRERLISSSSSSSDSSDAETYPLGLPADSGYESSENSHMTTNGEPTAPQEDPFVPTQLPPVSSTDRQLTVLSWNTKSLTERRSQLAAEIRKSKPAFVAITETHLAPTTSTPSFHGYICLRREDRQPVRGQRAAGGLILYMRKSFSKFVHSYRTTGAPDAKDKCTGSIRATLDTIWDTYRSLCYTHPTHKKSLCPPSPTVLTVS